MSNLVKQDALDIASFGTSLNVAVIGASGGIGNALADELEGISTVSNVARLSRSPSSEGCENWLHIDIENEVSIAKAAANLEQVYKHLNLIIVSTGLLHNANGIEPEKTWRSLNHVSMETAFRVNAIGPALVAKHFLPLLAPGNKSVFAALSARVGSIGDNQLGGWHAYRSSKAALNMLLKTMSIELTRQNPKALCVGLHPGTVDTGLSKPFQKNVAKEQLFTAKLSARHLLTVIDNLEPKDTGSVFAWDGSKIPH